MKTCVLSELFELSYGNGLELVKLKKTASGVNFVARTQKNNGVVAKVERPLAEHLFRKGLITVAVSGSVMESFLQTEDFLTSYHVMILRPKEPMTDEVKLFYCHCLRMNKFKYSYGRQANSTLHLLQVPCLEEAVAFVCGHTIAGIENAMMSQLDLSPLDARFGKCVESPLLVPLSELFWMKNGITSSGIERLSYKKNGNWIPYVRPSYRQSTSIDSYVNRNFFMKDEIFPEGTLYVSTNGQGSHTYSYVSVCDFVPNSDVTVLIPKRTMTLREKLFYSLCITHNRFKFSYGRKPKGDKLAKILIPSEIPQKYDNLELIKTITS